LLNRFINYFITISVLFIVFVILSSRVGTYIASHPYDESEYPWYTLLIDKDLELEAILGEVSIEAKERGFVFERPAIRRAKLWFGYFNHRAAAITSHEGDLILINSLNASHINRDGYVGLIAHELGHVIDVQSKRNGNPFFNNIKHLDPEIFASVIAAHIYSREFMEKVQKENFIVIYYEEPIVE
jgi:hypothetical protein